MELAARGWSTAIVKVKQKHITIWKSTISQTFEIIGELVGDLLVEM